MMRRILKYFAMSVGLFVVFMIWALFIREPSGSVYREFTSPDGQYKITVYRYPMLFSSVGGASDAPGRVELTNKEGKVLQSAKVSMVQLVMSEPEWTKNEVRLTGAQPDWPLE